MPDQAVLDGAFRALEQYAAGKPRADLIPIDDAVRAAAGDRELAGSLAQRLVEVVKRGAFSRAARRYACDQLGRVGGDEALARLEALLADADLGEDARAALEMIPGAGASAALRRGLRRVQGEALAGVMVSLGVRRDAASVSELARWIGSGDRLVSESALGALGAIGSVEAGRVLGAAVPTVSGDLREVLADAALTCIERLREAGAMPEAAALAKALDTAQMPKHVRERVALLR